MSSLQPSSRARAVAESATLAVTAKVQELRRQGKDVISLGAGEPDFPTPEPVAAAGVHAIHSGNTRYTAATGTMELREAAAGWFGRSIGLQLAPSEVIVTAGAKPALHVALLALVERGDPVLIPAPYWVSYPDLVRIAGGVPVEIPPVPEQGFLHTGAQIAAAARQHQAKGLILNYPNNPSGANPTRSQLADVVTAALAAGLWILSDEIYAALIYDGGVHTSPATLGAARERTLVVAGGTKSHSLTGWRVGFLAGPAPIIAACGRIQSQVIGNPCTISQAAALEVCRMDSREELARRLAAFATRRRFLVEEFARIKGLALTPPQGAFYALVDAREVCARLRTSDLELTTQLLDETGVACMPGSAFAIPGFLRFSYAASLEELREAMSRLRGFMARR